MWVAPEASRSGRRPQLCDACADWAAAHGFDALNVAVFPDNAPARRIYEAAGFVFSPRRWSGGGRTLDELILGERCSRARRRQLGDDRLHACVERGDGHPDDARDLARARCRPGAWRRSAGRAGRAVRPLAPARAAPPLGSMRSPRTAQQQLARSADLSTTLSAPAIAAAQELRRRIGKVEDHARARRLGLHPPDQPEPVDDQRRRVAAVEQREQFARDGAAQPADASPGWAAQSARRPARTAG